MIVTGLDNKEYKFNFVKHVARKNREGKSSLHIKAREVIKEVFPGESVYEEVTLPGTKRQGRKSLLYADFFLPRQMLVVEVHGEQHYKYNSRFHKSLLHFYECQRRDKDKREWCVLNNLKIIELPYNEEKQWKSLILSEIAKNQ